MDEVKNTRRSKVRLSYDGKVFKEFKGCQAEERFNNEVLVLKYLEEKGCPFVPRIIYTDQSKLLIVTTNCGKLVEHISDRKKEALFAELEGFGVRHEDAYARNITYRVTDGRFCIIDFEFATVLDNPNHKSPQPFQPK